MCYDESGSEKLPAKGRMRRKTPWARVVGSAASHNFSFESAAEESGFLAVPDGFAGSAGGSVIQTDKMK